MSADPLTAPLPARWGWGQRLKNDLIYVAIRLGVATLSVTPFVLARAALRGVAWLALRLVPTVRKPALRHLAIALPQLESRERGRVVAAMMRHLADSVAELTHLQRVDAQLAPEHRALFERALAEGKGVVAVTGHIGNWELLARAVASELDTTTLARGLYDPRLTRWVHAWRTAGGLEVIWRGQASGARQMLEVFRRDAILAVLIHQDTKVAGDFVQFFGRPAHTPTAAATLALRTGAPVIVGWIHRVDGAHRIHFERLEVGAQDDARTLTQRLTARLEDAIRERPEQWVWMHERWKRAPADASTEAGTS